MNQSFVHVLLEAGEPLWPHHSLPLSRVVCVLCAHNCAVEVEGKESLPSDATSVHHVLPRWWLGHGCDSEPGLFGHIKQNCPKGSD